MFKVSLDFKMCVFIYGRYMTNAFEFYIDFCLSKIQTICSSLKDLIKLSIKKLFLFTEKDKRFSTASTINSVHLTF